MSKLTIVAATYGANTPTDCKAQIEALMAQNGGSLIIESKTDFNSLFGDKEPGKAKYLAIKYKYPPFGEQLKTWAERHETINLPAVQLSAGGTLQVMVKNAIGLKNTRMLGKSNPYVKMVCGGEKFETKPHKDGGTNPQWNQAFVFNIDGKDPSMHITVMDEEIGTDTMIGRVDLPLSQLCAASGDVAWPLYDPSALTKQYGTLMLNCLFRDPNAPAAAPAAAAPAPAPAQPQVVYMQAPAAAPAQPQVVYMPAPAPAPAQPQVVYMPAPAPVAPQPQVVYMPAPAPVAPQPQVVYQQPASNAVGLQAKAHVYAAFQSPTGASLAAALSQDSVFIFQNEASGESMRNGGENGVLTANGAAGAFAQWKVHRLPSGSTGEPRIKFENVNNPGKYARVEGDGKTVNALGGGGEFCYFDVIQFDNGLIAFRAVVFHNKGQQLFLAFDRNGNVASPSQVNYPPEVRFKPFLVKAGQQASYSAPVAVAPSSGGWVTGIALDPHNAKNTENQRFHYDSKTGVIRGWDGRVFDIFGNSRDVGSKVSYGPYNGQLNQQWDYVDGMFRTRMGTGFVIDIWGGADAVKHGAELKMANAHNRAWQRWHIDDYGFIRSMYNPLYVMDIKGGISHGGMDDVVLYPAKHRVHTGPPRDMDGKIAASTENQRFRYDRASGLIYGWDGRVLDVFGASRDIGARLSYGPKNGNTNQQWDFVNGELITRMGTGFVVDVWGGASAVKDGSELRLGPSNGGAWQKWDIDGNGFIRCRHNPRFVLDVYGFNSHGGMDNINLFAAKEGM